jgi:branched-chain amino acid transport system ATP-binding protein
MSSLGIRDLWGGYGDVTVLKGVTLTVEPGQVVALVPEGKQLFPQMTVEENLLVGSTCPRAKADRARSLEEVYTLFPDLTERRAQKAGSMSGGQQQMVAVGRALMAKPTLLAMDEPSLGLAPVVVERLFEVLRQIRQTGLTLLLIEQNVQQVLAMADRGYVMENGQIVLTGSGRELLGNEHLKTHYLGV